MAFAAPTMANLTSQDDELCVNLAWTSRTRRDQKFATWLMAVSIRATESDP